MEETSERAERRRLSSCYQPSNTSDRYGARCGNIARDGYGRKGVEVRRGREGREKGQKGERENINTYFSDRCGILRSAVEIRRRFLEIDSPY